MGPSLFASFGMEGWLSETGKYENPLVPNAKLRQMYVAMAEARVLDEHIAALQKNAKTGRAGGGWIRLGGRRLVG